MSSDYSSEHSDISINKTQGKKNLIRGRKVDADLDHREVFENDGFQDEIKANYDFDENNRNWQNLSKTYRITDNPLPSKNGANDDTELKERDTNAIHKPQSNSQMSRSDSDPIPENPVPEPESNTKWDIFNRMHFARPSFTMNRLRAARPSLSAEIVQRGFVLDSEDGIANLPFARSQSVRVTSSRKSEKVEKPRRRLLREMSLSDSDDIVTKDYGSMGKIRLPRRHSESDLPNDSSISILVTTMQDLVDRGKIYQVMVIDIDSCSLLASLPDAEFSQSDANGMVKSLTCSPTIFKINICGNVYSCFKHSATAVQGRSDEVVMVMQKTNTCLVVAFSREDAPGACQSEVMEFSRVLERADW